VRRRRRCGTLGETAEMPVFIAPGNHDWYCPGEPLRPAGVAGKRAHLLSTGRSGERGAAGAGSRGPRRGLHRPGADGACWRAFTAPGTGGCT
jgi:hypothetical protein